MTGLDRSQVLSHDTLRVAIVERRERGVALDVLGHRNAGRRLVPRVVARVDVVRDRNRLVDGRLRREDGERDEIVRGRYGAERGERRNRARFVRVRRRERGRHRLRRLETAASGRGEPARHERGRPTLRGQRRHRLNERRAAVVGEPDEHRPELRLAWLEHDDADPRVGRCRRAAARHHRVVERQTVELEERVRVDAETVEVGEVLREDRQKARRGGGERRIVGGLEDESMTGRCRRIVDDDRGLGPAGDCPAGGIPRERGARRPSVDDGCRVRVGHASIRGRGHVVVTAAPGEHEESQEGSDEEWSDRPHEPYLSASEPICRRGVSAPRGTILHAGRRRSPGEHGRIGSHRPARLL